MANVSFCTAHQLLILEKFKFVSASVAIAFLCSPKPFPLPRAVIQRLKSNRKYFLVVWEVVLESNVLGELGISLSSTSETDLLWREAPSVAPSGPGLLQIHTNKSHTTMRFWPSRVSYSCHSFQLFRVRSKARDCTGKMWHIFLFTF